MYDYNPYSFETKSFLIESKDESEEIEIANLPFSVSLKAIRFQAFNGDSDS